MCYTVYVSTTSNEALDLEPCPLYRFEHLTDGDDPAIYGLLAYPSRWYLSGQWGGCSCHFRHAGQGWDLGFSPPADWCPEDEDDIAATGAVYDLLRRLVDGGESVDSIDVWSGTEPWQVETMGVSLAEVPRESFRFMEGRRFVFSP